MASPFGTSLVEKIIPLFKKGNKSLPTNFRPIALLSCFSKVFKKHLNNQLQQHNNRNNLLINDHNGFHNCVTTVFKTLLCQKWIKIEKLWEYF